MKKLFLPVLFLVALTLTGCRATYSADVTDPTQAVESLAAADRQELTKEEAQAIALERAGFTADQVTGLQTEYEVDDGVALYEVTFYADGWEYDYEINAKTGDLLSYDRDRD